MIGQAFVFAAFAAGALLGIGGLEPLQAEPADQHEPTKAVIYVLELDQEAIREISDDQAAVQEALDSVIKIIRGRLSSLRPGSASVNANEDEQIVIAMLPGHDRDDLMVVLNIGTTLEFGLVTGEITPGDPAPSDLPLGTRILPMPDGLPAATVRIIEGLDGRRIENAVVGFEVRSDEPVLNLSFDQEGQRIFGELTAANVGQKIAIILDGQVITAPIVREPILGGSVQISGRFTSERAAMLAVMIRSGALPVAVTLVEERAAP